MNKILKNPLEVTVLQEINSAARVLSNRSIAFFSRLQFWTLIAIKMLFSELQYGGGGGGGWVGGWGGGGGCIKLSQENIVS